MVSRYSSGKIYKIVNNIDQLIYVGSTIKSLSQRFSVHKCEAKRSPNIKLYKHFAKHGIDHFEIILIKLFPCNNRTELDIEEERIKIRLNAQLNTNRAHQTSEQLKEQIKEYQKEYQNEYYQNNRAKIRLRNNERLFCTYCGKTYAKANKSRHCKTKWHKFCVQLNKSKISTDEKYEKLTKIKQA
jgi:hypothetical protein